MDKKEMYEISDFDCMKLCNLDLVELHRRALFLQEKLNDVLASIESNITSSAKLIFEEKEPQSEVSIHDDGSIGCSVQLTHDEVPLAQVADFADQLDLDIRDISIDLEDGVFLYWTLLKE